MKKKVFGRFLAAALALGLTGCTENMETGGGARTDAEEEMQSGVEAEAQTNTQTTQTQTDTQTNTQTEQTQTGTDGFICGMDVSSVIAEEDSGVVYYNWDGEEADLFEILSDAGINYIRVRVWNDPYDENGNGYGGGNCDTAKAAEIGARAAKYGMKLLVDFHYSDFWADPKKQMAPKAWENLSEEDKQQALYEFTKESLCTILDAGANVGMVQIGNEINNGMAGEISWEKVTPLLIKGGEAVRNVAAEYGREILVAVHFTDIEYTAQTLSYPEKLQEGGVDYDVFGVSYYPSWHGSLENLTNILTEISGTYGKKVAVLETSYPYTTEDGDGFGNSISTDGLIDGYPATAEGQADCIRDVIAATKAAGDAALGVFYWEGAWIPVGDTSQYEENQKLWETYGSGWASSYSAEYDPNDAGMYYGGSSWDNQALFDFTGHPLESLKAFGEAGRSLTDK